MYKKLEKNI